MLRVALTGGLASGKSFIGKTLESLGCLLVQADSLGHQVLLPDGEAYAEVVAEFGRDILDPEGRIDRRKLAALVFRDPEKLARLNSFVHPPVRDRTEKLIRDFAVHKPTGIAVVEAAIHIETGGYRNFDRLILAWCRPEQQIERAMHRDGMTREEAQARLMRQMPLDEKKSYAHFVVDTSGTKEETVRQTEEVYRKLRSIAQ
ncbi:MAG: dephospho-CoA kinase [Bryobacteraceae bacterium]|nr:dephospho-CoA kinase [Bryobacteraceae bacterium]